MGQLARTKRKWTFGDYLLAVFGAIICAIFVWAALGKLGIVEPFGPPLPRVERPHWDNERCLREQAYRIRRADPMIGDDMPACCCAGPTNA